MPFPPEKRLHFALRTAYLWGVFRTVQDAEKPSGAVIFSVSRDISQTARRVSQAHAGAGMVQFWLTSQRFTLYRQAFKFCGFGAPPQIPQEFMRLGPRPKTSRGEAYKGREENGEKDGTAKKTRSNFDFLTKVITHQRTGLLLWKRTILSILSST